MKISIQVELVFSDEELATALLWGRKNKFTYEADKEIPELLAAAFEDGIIKGNQTEYLVEEL